MRIAVALAAALTLAVGASVVAGDTSFYTPPVVSVPKVKVPPITDGLLAPGEWAGAAALPPFVMVGGRAMPDHATEVWAAYDDHSLYIGAILHNPNPSQLKADATERDGAVWSDDSFELIFDTEDQRKSYIHLAVNPKEAQYDALGKDKAADYRWTARTATVTNGWTVELELPFANDYPPAAGIAWGFAVGRHCAADDGFSSWCRFEKSFHELDNIGSMVFSTTPPLPELSTLGKLWLGDNTAQVALRNLSDKSVACKVNTRVMGRDKRGDYFGTTKMSLAPGGKQSSNIPYRIQEDGFSTLVFSVTDAAGATIWRTAPYPVETPEVAPQIAAVEKALAATMREWMQLPAGDGKQALRDEMDGLAVQWRYLVRQYSDRMQLDRVALESLASYAGKLQSDVDLLAQRVKAAKQSGRTDRKYMLTAVPDTQLVQPGTVDLEPGLPVQLDACRNETESALVVVLPFR